MAENDIDLLDELDSTDFDFENSALPDDAENADDIDYLAGLDLSEEEETQTEKEKIESFINEKVDENKNFVKKAIDFVVNFVKTEKIISIVIGSLLLLLIVFLILICVLMGKGKKPAVQTASEKSVELPYDYVLPTSEILDDYTFSRDLKEKWTVEEGEKWFEVPEGKMMKELEDKNSENIYEILEAVP